MVIYCFNYKATSAVKFYLVNNYKQFYKRRYINLYTKIIIDSGKVELPTTNLTRT